MGWRDIAKVGRDWADAKRTEPLTTDNRTREQARGAAEDAERRERLEQAASAPVSAVRPAGTVRWA